MSTRWIQWTALTLALLPGRSATASKNHTSAKTTAKAAAKLGPAGIARGDLPGTKQVSAPKLGEAAQLENGSVVSILEKTIYVTKPAEAWSGLAPVPAGLVRRFDGTGRHEGTYRWRGSSTGTGRGLIYEPRSGLLARERPDGTWGVQRNVNGRFTKQTVLGDLHAVNRLLYDRPMQLRLQSSSGGVVMAPMTLEALRVSDQQFDFMKAVRKDVNDAIRRFSQRMGR